GRARREVEGEAQRRRGAVILEPSTLQRGSGPQQRQLALQQVVLADLADFEAPLIQRVERVVYGGVRDGVVERHACGVLVEEEVGRRERDVLQRLAILPLRELRAHRLLAAVPRRGVRPQDALAQSDGDGGRGPRLDRLGAAHGQAGQRRRDEQLAARDR